MSKHTPGPWQHVQEGGIDIVTSDNGRQDICHLSAFRTEHYANAALIAAAPDLLEACKAVVQYHREHDSGGGELFGLDFVTTCINAIRQAEGRTIPAQPTYENPDNAASFSG